MHKLNSGAGSILKSAVLLHEDSDFGTSTARLLAGKLSTIGTTVTEQIPHATPTRDFTNIAYRFKPAAPDLLITGNYPNEYQLLLRTIVQQRLPISAIYSVSGGGFNQTSATQQPQVAENMIDFGQWYGPDNRRAIDLRRRSEAGGHGFEGEVLLGYFAVRLLVDAMARAGSIRTDRVTIEQSSYDEHVMAFGPTRFINGQNTGARGVALQIQAASVTPIWPSQLAAAKPIFPPPRPG